MLPWRCPTLDDQEDDEEVRSEMSTKLRRLLGNEVRYFKWRRYEESRQRSIASLESGGSNRSSVLSYPQFVHVAHLALALSVGLAKMLAELDFEDHH